MIEYCPFCGHNNFMRYKGGDMWMCRACGEVVEPEHISRTRLKLELARMVTAANWLSGRYGKFTRLDFCHHLGVKKTPYTRRSLDRLVELNILTRSNGSHPQNGRSCWFYTRPVA